MAAIGSTRDARHAGKNDATMAEIVSRTIDPAMVAESVGCTRNNIEAIQ